MYLTNSACYLYFKKDDVTLQIFESTSIHFKSPIDSVVIIIAVSVSKIFKVRDDKLTNTAHSSRGMVGHEVFPL